MYRHMVEPKLPPFIPNAIGVAIEPEVNAKALEFRAADVNGTVNIAKVNADNAEASQLLPKTCFCCMEIPVFQQKESVIASIE